MSTEKSSSTRIRRMVGTAMLMAIVIVLQALSYALPIKVGPFSLSFVLVPVVVGAAVYGLSAGGILGAAFGAVVVINCITGGDAGGAIVYAASPFLCIVVVMAKGVLAGLATGGVYRLLAGKNTFLATVVSAIVCPLVNTGVFVMGMLLFFMDVLTAWAGGTELLNYIILSLVGGNFLIEVAINALLSPIIVRIIHSIRK